MFKNFDFKAQLSVVSCQLSVVSCQLSVAVSFFCGGEGKAEGLALRKALLQACTAKLLVWLYQIEANSCFKYLISRLR